MLALSLLMVPAAADLGRRRPWRSSAALAQGAEVTFDFIFERDAEGWTAGFADLPVDHDPQLFELDSAHRALPDGLHQQQRHVHAGPQPQR